MIYMAILYPFIMNHQTFIMTTRYVYYLARADHSTQIESADHHEDQVGYTLHYTNIIEDNDIHRVTDL